MKLEERVALVTGGGTGIGRAIAEGLAREGATVVVSGRREAPLAETVKAIEASGGRAAAVVLDVSDPRSVDTAGERIEKDHGGIDVLVNNSGVYPARPLFETSDEDWRAAIDTNLSGAFHTIRRFAPRMTERRWGRIVNVTSPSAFIGFPTMAAYSASKGGLVALTRSVAAALGPSGVTANCVCPGMTETEGVASEIGEDAIRGFAQILPLKRVGLPRDVVGSVLLLASDDGAYITGQTIVIDGGMLAAFPVIG